MTNPLCPVHVPLRLQPLVKCVLHWFQMMYSGRLSMFADGPASQYVPVTYDVARVSCPVAIVYGGRDHLGEAGPPADARAVAGLCCRFFAVKCWENVQYVLFRPLEEKNTKWVSKDAT